MALYEHTVMTRQDISAQQAEALNDTIKDLIVAGGGSVAKIEYWGLRNIAYRIAKNRKAHYVMLEIDAPGDTVAEIERQAGINEDIIRYMTVRVDELEQGPTVMMRKQERDRERRADRGERGGDRARVAVSQGNLTLRVRETPMVSQPNPFSPGETVVVPRTDADITQEPGIGFAEVSGESSLSDVVAGLNALGVRPRELIDILKAIHAAGALHAEFVVN